MTTPRYRTDHIHYRSRNAAAAARFWTDIFGATETTRVIANGNLRVVLDLGGLAIFVEEVPEGTGAPPPPPFLGLEHLALVVDDLDAAVADLTAKGAKHPACQQPAAGGAHLLRGGAGRGRGGTAGADVSAPAIHSHAQERGRDAAGTAG